MNIPSVTAPAIRALSAASNTPESREAPGAPDNDGDADDVKPAPLAAPPAGMGAAVDKTA